MRWPVWCVAIVAVAIPISFCTFRLFGHASVPAPSPQMVEPRISEVPLVVEGALSGEFEAQEAILFSWANFVSFDPQAAAPNDTAIKRTFVKVIAQIYKNIRVIILIRDDRIRQDAVLALLSAGVPSSSVQFITVPVNSIWARDFGPVSVETTDGTIQLADAIYAVTYRIRRDDDNAGSLLARFVGLDTLGVPAVFDGGNLLSNGTGLYVATQGLFEDNRPLGFSRNGLNEVLRCYYGAKETVWLEPLKRKLGSAHVDWFATFTSPDTIVVGKYSPDIDAENSAILERNAERLSEIQTPSGPLRVVRIPMPPLVDGAFRTYTNVLFANGKLLVPVYSEADPEGQDEALQTFQRLLPGWQVVGIDCEELMRLGGALRCISRNLTCLSPYPKDRTEDQRGVRQPFAAHSAEPQPRTSRFSAD